MFMSGPHSFEVSSASDHKSFETPQVPHHSPVCIEDQFSLQISHPPPESHDSISHALEES